MGFLSHASSNSDWFVEQRAIDLCQTQGVEVRYWNGQVKARDSSGLKRSRVWSGEENSGSGGEAWHDRGHEEQ
jgi:hypothetical protein